MSNTARDISVADEDDFWADVGTESSAWPTRIIFALVILGVGLAIHFEWSRALTVSYAFFVTMAVFMRVGAGRRFMWRTARESDYTSISSLNYQGQRSKKQTFGSRFLELVTGLAVVPIGPMSAFISGAVGLFTPAANMPGFTGRHIFLPTVIAHTFTVFLAASLLVFGGAELFWGGQYFLPICVNIAIFFGLLLMIIRPAILKSGINNSLWPKALSVPIILIGWVTAIVFVHVSLQQLWLPTDQPLTARLLSHSRNLLDMPGLGTLLATISDGGLGAVLDAENRDDLLTLHWTVLAILFSLATAGLLTSLFAKRTEAEALDIAKSYMRMGRLTEMRAVLDKDVSDSSVAGHEARALLEALEGNTAAYWRELHAYSERKYYTLYQDHAGALVMWVHRHNMRMLEKQPTAIEAANTDCNTNLGDAALAAARLGRSIAVESLKADPAEYEDIATWFAREADIYTKARPGDEALWNFAMAFMKYRESEAIANADIVPENDKSDTDKVALWMAAHALWGTSFTMYGYRSAVDERARAQYAQDMAIFVNVLARKMQQITEYVVFLEVLESFRHCLTQYRKAGHEVQAGSFHYLDAHRDTLKDAFYARYSGS